VSDYRVDLEAYNGPLDLLLFLVRREEVDIHDIPITGILDQYISYVQMLETLDPNAVGDFLVLAATLMEIKSRMLLPRAPVEEDQEDPLDPRLELVRQLLLYKAFKEAAHSLGSAAATRAARLPRNPPGFEPEPDQVDLEDAQVWDLLAAFRRLLDQTGQAKAWHDVVYDDTPIALNATDISDFLEREGGSARFEAIFEGRSKGQLIGLFLALLEMIHQRRVRAEQEEPFGPIILHLIDSRPLDEPRLESDSATGADETAPNAADEARRAADLELAADAEAESPDDASDWEDEEDELLRTGAELLASSDRKADAVEQALEQGAADSHSETTDEPT